MIAPDVLALLACPKCHSRPPLRLEDTFLVCTECGCGYPILNGIPHLLIDEAISRDQVEKAMKNSLREGGA